jgi:hypothetical protein
MWLPRSRVRRDDAGSPGASVLMGVALLCFRRECGNKSKALLEFGKGQSINLKVFFLYKAGVFTTLRICPLFTPVI